MKTNALNAETKSFWDVLNNMSSNDLAVLCLLLFLLATLSVVLIATTVSRMHKNRLEIALKRELVDRGLSTDEIAKFVETSAVPSKRWPILRCLKTTKQPSGVNV
jgi:hypothetical protein